MFKKILVATDASEYSRRALEKALELARIFGGEVELLHVVYIKEAYWGYNEVYSVLVSPEQIEDVGEHTLEETLQGIEVGNVPLKKKIVQGYPATMIVEEVEKEGIDLVVMGSHGYGPIAGSVLGSVSQRVLQHAGCAVLIVK